MYMRGRLIGARAGAYLAKRGGDVGRWYVWDSAMQCPRGEAPRERDHDEVAGTVVIWVALLVANDP